MTVKHESIELIGGLHHEHAWIYRRNLALHDE